ncbi:LLM class flavin-dependent oxidoreductase [Pseudonocardia alaniniphila]|uniref:LLM class flavin-dependent oxidoreductase n=1 Tax=Pseudonocardia alaniniphila TaxID=75291 RepID=A0ABS9TTY6_9PSEU|nr:LLM class flavin-dependent oxidoreductase [Pseudonocardia alaniniphila]MCH6172038.1 LLM class flavin-dependent oxidoreductase [Pseudonocardia alaniniphila]
MLSVPLSAMDLSWVERGRGARHALTSTVELARRVEKFGYHRFWVAEHHSSATSASAAPAVLIGQITAATSAIRVGSGGVMLNNHAPLAVAEQFATLDALHPGRVDLGIGRGPGTRNAAAIRSLRRGDPDADGDHYEQHVRDLLGFIAQDTAEAVTVLPEFESATAPWLLSSSTAGAALAAELGLPLAFAHHLRPQNTDAAIAVYRENFRPSRWASRSYALVAVHTICADTDERADELARPAYLWRALLATGKPGSLLPRAEAAGHAFTAEEQQFVDGYRTHQVLGDPDSVARQLTDLAERTGADELMLQTPVYDIADRARSFELVAAARAGTAAAASDE